MTKEELIKLKEWISKLSPDEIKERKLYLRSLESGEMQGPPVGYASIDKPWLKSYEKDVLLKDLPKMKMFEYLYNNNKNNLNCTAINYFGNKISYKNLFMYALNKIGAVCNLLDPRINAEQIEESINSTKSEYAIIIDLCHPKFDKIMDNTSLKKIIAVSVSDSLPFVLNCGMRLKNYIKYLKSKEKPLTSNDIYMNWSDFIEYGNKFVGRNECEYEENMPAIIVRTSGTTGNPKSVVHSNESVNSLAFQYNYCGVPHKYGDKFLNIMPLFLMYGLSCGIHMPLSLGMTNILVPQSLQCMKQ